MPAAYPRFAVLCVNDQHSHRNTAQDHKRWKLRPPDEYRFREQFAEYDVQHGSAGEAH